jgi:hypothetical protein
MMRLLKMRYIEYLLKKIIPYQGMYLDVNYDGGWKHGVVKSVFVI